jgi:hypothetical protein
VSGAPCLRLFLMVSCLVVRDLLLIGLSLCFLYLHYTCLGPSINSTVYVRRCLPCTNMQSPACIHAEIYWILMGYPINLQAVVFNRPTLAIFSAGLGEPILFKISGLVYVYVVNLKNTILYFPNFGLFYQKFLTVHNKYKNNIKMTNSC